MIKGCKFFLIKGLEVRLLDQISILLPVFDDTTPYQLSK